MLSIALAGFIIVIMDLLKTVCNGRQDEAAIPGIFDFEEVASKK